MILQFLIGPIWPNSVQRKSSDTVMSRLPTYNVLGSVEPIFCRTHTNNVRRRELFQLRKHTRKHNYTRRLYTPVSPLVASTGAATTDRPQNTRLQRKKTLGNFFCRTHLQQLQLWIAKIDYQSYGFFKSLDLIILFCYRFSFIPDFICDLVELYC